MTVIRKRTKIVATLGPATNTKEILEKIIAAGVNLVRLNFSHGDAKSHIKLAKLVRSIAKEQNTEVGILADLQGPKIRIASFKKGSVDLKKGADFSLDTALDSNAGDATKVGISYQQLTSDVQAGDRLLLDDGRLVLKVVSIKGTVIACKVVVGGTLSNNKGINKEGGGISADALTEKDKQDLKTAAMLQADYVAVSFVRHAEDISNARMLLNKQNCHAGIVAKIERREACENIDPLIKAADAVMVARGDLGVEIGDAELPAVQKKIIGRARALDKCVITATQMMESMIENSIPTRAEVFDVANAVIDGTDAVMLSAETAAGKNPDKVVSAMSRICLGAERQRITQVSGHRVECEFNTVDEAIAMATMYTANHLKVKAIIAMTESGLTPLWMSRIRSGIPIFGLSRNALTLRKMTLFRGVYPIFFDPTQYLLDEINGKAIEALQKDKILETGDLAIITRGDFIGVHGGSNSMKIVYV